MLTFGRIAVRYTLLIEEVVSFTSVPHESLFLTLCIGGPNDHLQISNVVITPDPPQIGANLTVAAEGVLGMKTNLFQLIV